MSPEFQAHILNDEGKKKAEKIANSYNLLQHSLKDDCMGGEEFDQAKHYLEISCFYAKKAMSVDPSNQQ